MSIHHDHSTPETGARPAPGRYGLRRLMPRQSAEPHRTASTFELFFDLVFVVAVSVASVQLHHMETEGHLGAGVMGYLMVFFAIWWAWMNFTWFATSFDNDDWLYRLLTIVQMAGVLVLAAGSADAMAEHDFTVITIGYAIMRFAVVAQWLRAASTPSELRAVCLRYAAGISIVQIAWILRLALPADYALIGFFVLAAAEVAIPMWAERKRPTPWNPHHITERYGLFTLILLGESILASANAIIGALHEGQHLPELLLIAAAGLIIAAGMWWVYFARPHHHHIRTLASSLRYGYFHYCIFAAAGAFSAGVEISIDTTEHSSHLSGLAAGATLTIPVVVFMLGIWVLTVRTELTRTANSVFLAGIIVILLSTLASGSVSMIAITAVGVVISTVAVELPLGHSTASQKRRTSGATA